LKGDFMAEMNDLGLGGVRALVSAPPSGRHRVERCETCHWCDRVPGGGLECHGDVPTLNLVVEPGGPLRPGQQVLRPICIYPPVKVDGFCRHWVRVRGEVSASEVPISVSVVGER
jgi:hypothetical protein